MTQNSDPTATTLSYYRSNAQEFVDGTVSVAMGEFYREFLSLIPKGGAILDAGCGSGRDTKFLLQKGYDVVAFDNCPEIVKIASEHTNHDIRLLSFSDITFKDQFDGIWACASLLHLPTKDMPDALTRLNNALKNKGIIYTSFKYGEGESVRNQRFFSDHTESSFGNLVQNIPNFEVLKYWKTNDLRTGREHEKWLNILLKKVSC